MPQNMDRRKRNIRKEIYFKPEEYEQVKYAMEQMKAPSFQYYAKNQLVQGKLVQIDFSELKNLRVAVNRIGGNINQIAKYANENQTIASEELAQVLGLLSEIKEMVTVKLSNEEKRSLLERKRTVRTDIDEW
ncbi:TPA: plasmid mobilization relaxosome protein MobC [Streptococcus agalactiae]|uniref:plasmid mobilization relaxosome protein MobC n=1 Tax=Streptococcus agalactiae TaxID=1311 RepID=UPI000B6D22B3|nr:plasmid mobilization relaxosome protein MobC [Streptococcus agalactiae]RRA76877.1 plasmid mobilization relaxosome protein MobC [Streptococcus agalactiae]RRA79536.1 plasmid mobilization relaxosome protein MobC [Streptococcus agalactiae]RRA85620.1 plasmid mobilization relaxosome protein MobC [Streptococcus agalactiae]HEO6584683.1 plasmid mobilization relaxosome protein MobC [Streptococcus agalactiae]